MECREDETGCSADVFVTVGIAVKGDIWIRRVWNEGGKEKGFKNEN